MGKLDDKVAIITGGVSGIGAATSKLFAREGAKLVIVDYNEGLGQEFLGEMKEEGYEDVIFVQADVSKPEEADRVFDEAMDKFGRLDILYNNAGIGIVGPTHEYSYDDYLRMIDVDLNSVFIYSQRAIKIFLDQGEGGSILNTASMYGLVGSPTNAAYNAAKGGVVNMTKSLALEYAKEGIRVNAICPGYIRTPLVADEIREALAEATPVKRLGEPEEVANLALLLASDDCKFLTGAAIPIDGGYTAQ